MWCTIRGYLHYRKPVLFCFSGMSGALCLILWLFGVPLEPGLYTIWGAGMFLAIWLAVDFYRFFQHHRDFSIALRCLSKTAPVLPESQDLLQRDNLAIIEALYSLIRRLDDQRREQAAEQSEYYTLWIHQIKTPLAAARLILPNIEPHATRSMLEQQMFQIERYADMALQYARLDTIEQDISPHPCNLKRMINHCIKKYAPLLIGKHLSVSIDVPPDLMVLTDEKWCCFILEQVLSNAVKYTKSGGVCLYILPGKKTVLAIEDTGCGIQPQDLPRVFEKGFTGIQGREDKRASGIGLYLSKRAAAALCMQLRCESEPGNGTRMLITFPDKEAEIVD